jgi:two-component system NtrC family sensor kinase
VRETLSRISNQIQRARGITTRLLNVARPPGKARSLIDVNRVVEDTLAFFSYNLERGGVTVNKQLSPEIPPLCDDDSRLSQILMNLTLNSIQAMANGGGSLRVATAADNGTIRIEVEDSGDGIPRENLAKIYEPFFTTKPVGKGTGLGLFITHRLVAEMGGSIGVRSQPGQGSLFTVRLPLRREINTS